MSNIFITGTSKGIGFELANLFLNEGHNVFGCSRGESSIINKNYKHYTCDVSDENSVINIKNDFIKSGKNIDILINNAGIASMNHVLSTPLDSVKNIFFTNFFGTFLFTREFSKLMIKNKFGRIINFSTCAAALDLEGESAYASSKSAVESFSRITAKELAPFNITVNIVGITPYQTDLIRGVPSDKIEKLLSKQSINKFIKICDIKNIVDFFISKESSFITGQKIYLGGIN
jgi:3-oxoacyl-[acyl-carrier protein] reductase